MNTTGPTMNPLAWCSVAMQISGSLRIINVVHAYLLRPDRHEQRPGQCLHAPDGRCGACQEAAYSLSRHSEHGDYVRRRLVPLVTTTGMKWVGAWGLPQAPPVRTGLAGPHPAHPRPCPRAGERRWVRARC